MIDALHAAGVDLVVVGPDAVVPAGYARNLERIVAVLRATGARLRIAHGSELLDVEVTADLLEGERRTAWTTRDGNVELDLEPVPGLHFGALLLDAPVVKPGEPGPPWACDEHRARVAAARA